MDWWALTEKGKRLALVLGIGGGGDAFGTIPTRNSLLKSGFEVMIGSVVWERSKVDPKPGPRSIEELDRIEEMLYDVACIATGSTRISGGPKPQVCRIAEALNERVLIIDITKGVKRLAEGLRKVCELLSVGMVVGIDVGGDVLADGREEGLSSPLCDSMCLAGLAISDIRSVIGVYGLGCDGELKLNYLEERLSEMASRGCLIGAIGMTAQDLGMMEAMVNNLETEASRLAMLSTKGLRGNFPIRGGARMAQVSIISSITFFLDAKMLFNFSPLAKSVASSESLDDANDALHALGIKTELDVERGYSALV